MNDEVMYFENYDYASALIGISHDGRAVYDYDLMIEFLVKEGFSEEEAADWISYNTLRALPYFGEKAPIVVFKEEQEMQ